MNMISGGFRKEIMGLMLGLAPPVFKVGGFCFASEPHWGTFDSQLPTYIKCMVLL